MLQFSNFFERTVILSCVFSLIIDRGCVFSFAEL